MGSEEKVGVRGMPSLSLPRIFLGLDTGAKMAISVSVWRSASTLEHLNGKLTGIAYLIFEPSNNAVIPRDHIFHDQSIATLPWSRC